VLNSLITGQGSAEFLNNIGQGSAEFFGQRSREWGVKRAWVG
jgi:hypothetical protein